MKVMESELACSINSVLMGLLLENSNDAIKNHYIPVPHDKWVRKSFLIASLFLYLKNLPLLVKTYHILIMKSELQTLACDKFLDQKYEGLSFFIEIVIIMGIVQKALHTFHSWECISLYILPGLLPLCILPHLFHS